MQNGITSGIYLITCTANGRQYIGSSWNIHNRLSEHMLDLERGEHDNPALAADFLLYGAEAFTAEVLEVCRIGRKAIEQRHLDRAKAQGIELYNMRRAFNPPPVIEARIGGQKRSMQRSQEREPLTPEQQRDRMAEAARFVNVKRRSATQNKIIAAISSLASEGVSDPSLTQIAKRADVSAVTVSRWRRRVQG